ncbi:MAG: hypothetical protein IIY69_06835, partial [Clostridia bacterium]|nr:hypothetical protein [Clostridia bacterium]
RTFVTKSTKSLERLPPLKLSAPSLSGSLFAPHSARRYLMRILSAPFIVGMRALFQVFEAFRYESSFKTVFPPIGAVAPVTSAPDGGYAGFSKKVFICRMGTGVMKEKTCISLSRGGAKKLYIHREGE